MLGPVLCDASIKEPVMKSDEIWLELTFCLAGIGWFELKNFLHFGH